MEFIIRITTSYNLSVGEVDITRLFGFSFAEISLYYKRFFCVEIYL